MPLQRITPRGHAIRTTRVGIRDPIVPAYYDGTPRCTVRTKKGHQCVQRATVITPEGNFCCRNPYGHEPYELPQESDFDQPRTSRFRARPSYESDYEPETPRFSERQRRSYASGPTTNQFDNSSAKPTDRERRPYASGPTTYRSADSSNTPFERERRPYTSNSSTDQRRRSTPTPRERPSSPSTRKARPENDSKASGSFRSAERRCEYCYATAIGKRFRLNRFKICRSCCDASNQPLLEQYRQWETKVNGLIAERKMTSFPFIPPIFMDCSRSRCRDAKAQGLRACVHDYDDFYEAGEISSAGLKKERNKWHPDRFANLCTQEFREEGRILADDLFKIIGQVMDER